MATGEQQRLAALYERRILDTPPEERFDRVTRLARRLFDVDEALVSLIDADRQWIKSTSNGPDGSGSQVPRKESFCTTTIAERHSVVVEDALLDERFRTNPHVTGPNPVRFYAGVPIAAPGGELVGTLCLVSHQPRRLNQADLALLADLAHWIEQELNLDEELERAAAVQRALLPATPPNDPAWDIAGTCHPSRDVGGDFYDWHHTAGHTTIALADVMGKGMPAAIVAATARAALRANAHPSPAHTLTTTTATLAHDLHATDTFVTAFIATTADDGTITYADAGHGHAAILRADATITTLARGRTPIGVTLHVDHTSPDHHAHLHPGDTLIAHSDGLLELPHGPRTTAELLHHLHGSPDATHIRTRIDALIGNAAPADDATAVIVRRPTPPGA